MKNYNICLCADNDYIKYVAVLVNSIIEHLTFNKNEQIVFHLFCKDISEYNRIKLDEFISILNDKFLVQLKIYNCDDEKYTNFQRWGENSNYSTYLRFAISELSDEINKILYLDSDMLCYSDIREIFKIDLDGKTAAVAIDPYKIGDSFIRFRPKKLFYPAKKLDLSIHKYFNAGLLLINLPRWKSKKISEKAIEFLTKYKAPLNDQDALNFVLRGDVNYISPKWNLMWNWYMDEFLDIRKDILKKLSLSDKKYLNPYDNLTKGIVHFASHYKPWKFKYYVITDGYCDKIPSVLQRDYMKSACNTVCFGDNFNFTNNKNDMLASYQEDLGFWLTHILKPRYIRNKKRIKRVKIFSVLCLCLFIIELFLVVTINYFD